MTGLAKLSMLRGAVLGVMLCGGFGAGAQMNATEGTVVDAQLISADNLEGLRALLIPHGWGVDRDSKGGLLLFPPEAESNAEGGATRDSPQQSVQGFEALRRHLEATGWNVAQDAGGNLLLSARGVAAPRPGGPRAEPTPAASGFAHLRRELEASGWLVERAPDGSVLLYPTREQLALAQSGAEQAATGFDRLRKLLEASGWRAERSSDGGLLLYPKPGGVVAETPPAQTPIDTSLSCQGFSLPVTEQAGLTLPVDSLNEAREIASGWLQAFAGEGLTLGRIRRILRLHLVSIVEDNPPFRLRNQLVIRNKDGCVMAVM